MNKLVLALIALFVVASVNAGINAIDGLQAQVVVKQAQIAKVSQGE